MLQVLVHDDCTLCAIACYGVGKIIFLIVTVNMEYHIIVLITRDFVFLDINHFCMDFFSSRFCWVIWSLSFYLCQHYHISWVGVFHNLLSFAITAASFDLGLLLESLTGTQFCRLQAIYIINSRQCYLKSLPTFRVK